MALAKKQVQVYDEKTTPLILEGLLRRGWDKRRIAEWLNVNVRTVDYWIKTKKEIRELFAKAPRKVLFDIERALLKRAMGYDVEEVTTEVVKDPKSNKVTSVKVKTVKKHIPADIAAIKMVLSTYDPKYWGDLKEISLTQVNTQINLENKIPKIVLGSQKRDLENIIKIDSQGRKSHLGIKGKKE